MAEDWAAIAAEVAGALGEVGTPATIIRRVRSGGPDYAPTYTNQRTDCRVVLDEFTVREREGTSIAATDLKVLAPTLGFEITSADLLEMNGAAYEIVEPAPTRPGGVAVVWQFGARR